MTDKLNYGNVMEILKDICKKNGISVKPSILGYRTYRFTFINYADRASWCEFDCTKCDLTLYEFLEYIKNHLERNHYTKNNFDWSYYMKKAFTKADLKNGDVVKNRDGGVEIVCLETDTLIAQNGGFDRLSALNNDLTYGDGTFKLGDIMAVRRPKQPHECSFRAFDEGYGELVYERSEPVEMTLEEVCEALGKDIKIVKR